MSISMIDVAVIGAGLAGLSCAQHLHAAGHQVVMFDKARGVGGRLSTRRTEDTTFDHGAQYFTARDPYFVAQVEQWQQQQVVQVWDAPIAAYQAGCWSTVDVITRYVGKPRMNSVARHMLKDLPCHLQHRLIKLEHQGQYWCLHFEQGDVYHAKTVVLAIPAPQLVPLLAQTHPFMPIVAAVDMQATWAVMLTLQQPVDLAYGGIFVNDQRTLSWAAQNHTKPERSAQPTWVLHSQPDWAQQHQDADPAWVMAQMIEEFQSLLQQPLQIKQQQVHRWLYALAAAPLFHRSLWDDRLRLGIAGDWLCGSRVEGAWCSGRSLAQSINPSSV